MLFRHKYRYYFIVLLSLYTLINTELCQVYTHFFIHISWYNALLVIFLITLSTWEVNSLINPLLQKKLPANWGIVKRSAVFFICGFVISCIITIVIDILYSAAVPGHGSIDNPLKLTIIYTSLLNLLYHLINLVYIYQYEYQKKKLESEELKRMQAQAELSAIKQQINPHFLFNNLNVLSGLVMKQSNDANKFVEAFSQVYMHILNNHNKELIELQQELAFLEPYSYLLKKRFENGLEIEVKVPGRYMQYYIIPVSLQMLVENAIKHNIVSSKKPLHITIYANGNNSLSVINNLQPKLQNERSSNIGLNNIQKRYQLITGKEISIEKNGLTFAVSLPLIEINNHESIDNRR